MSCNIGDTYGRAEELLAFLLLRENLTKETKERKKRINYKSFPR